MIIMNNSDVKNQKDVILVVDDQPNNLKVIASVLGDTYTISIANNGANALKMLEILKPDLILLDVMMPDMDGYHVCKKIKENSYTCHIPVIFLTAKSDIDDIIKGFEIGGIDYITKPFNPKELRVRVKNHLDLFHAQNSLIIRNKIRSVINNASELFLRNHEWESEINPILKGFMNILNLSHVSIFQNSFAKDGSLLMNLKYGCSASEADDYSSYFYSLQNVPYQNYGVTNFLTELKNNEHVILSSDSNEYRKFFYLMKAESILIMPLFAENLFWGFIEFDVNNKERIWLDLEIEALRLLTNIIGAAINRNSVEKKISILNSSLLNELELASTVQLYILPDWLKIDEKMIFSSAYKPSNKIGGDLFDYIKLSEDRYVTYVGDVSGHGVQAALVMTAVKSILNMLINSEKDDIQPHLIIDKLSRIMSEGLLHNNYLTIVLCFIDLREEKILYFNAGHPPLIQYDLANHNVKIIDKNSSIPVGWLPDFRYEAAEQVELPFMKNYIYIAYSDGIFECENPQGEQLGIAGLTSLIEKRSSISYSILLPYIIKQKLFDLDYDINADDFTLISFARINKNLEDKYQKILFLNAKSPASASLANQCKKIIIENIDNYELAEQVKLFVEKHLNFLISQKSIHAKDANIALEITVSELLTLKFWDKGTNWLLSDIEENKEDFGQSDYYQLNLLTSPSTSFTKNRIDNVNESIITILNP